MNKKDLVNSINKIREELSKPYIPIWKYMQLRKSQLISQLSFYKALKEAGGSFNIINPND